MIYFLIVYHLFFLGLAWFKPKYSLFLILALLPTYQIRFQVFGVPLTLLETMIVILFVVYLIQNIKIIIREKKKFFSWQWLILIWLAIATIAVFISPDLRSAAGVWKAYFIEPILLLIVFIGLIKNRKDLNYALGALIFSGFYISIWAILQRFSLLHILGFGGQVGGGVLSTEIWGQPQIWRATGPFPHPNFLGLYLGPIILLAIGQVFYFFKKNKIITGYGLLIIVLSFIAIVLARSEGAILGVFAGIIFLGLIYNKQARKWTIGSLAVLIIIIGLLPGVRGYVIEKATFSDLSGQLRVNIWKGSARLIKEQPILGAGLNGYQRLAPAYQERYYHPETNELISVETHPYPHNLFFTMWLELGLAGLFIFLLIIVRFFNKGFQKVKKQDAYNLQFLIYGSMAAMVVILIHGLVDTPYFKNDLSILFWIIIGIVAQVNHLDKS